MKYAFWPGCVSKGACPELYQSMIKVSAAMGIELVELWEGNCTGAGFISEHKPQVADALNARNFALAERLGLPLMNICSTCQGVMSAVDNKFKEHPEYLIKVNETLAEEGLHYSGNLTIKNFLWVIVEDFGVDKLRGMVTHPLTGLRVGPFYGCFIVRPTNVLGFEENPQRDHYLEMVIQALGAEPVDYSGKDKCCGFPIMTMNRKNALTQAGNHVQEAILEGADCLVTPCPLCHLNLDGQQPDAAKVRGVRLGLPVLHLPQLVGLALGMDAKELRLDRHVVTTQRVLEKVGA